MEIGCPPHRRPAALQARRVLGHRTGLRRAQGDLGRPEGRVQGGRVQRLRPRSSHRGRSVHHPAQRIPDGRVRRVGQPVPAAHLLHLRASQPHRD